MSDRHPILVTGANGFIGSHLTEALLTRGDRVRVLVRKSSSLKYLPDAAERVVGAVGHPVSLVPAVRGVRTVYHVAGVVSTFRNRTFKEVNVDGTRNLVRACLKAAPDLERFVLVSSVAAGGPAPRGRPRRESERPRPVSCYGRSKLRGERALIEEIGDLPFTIIRPPVIYGPRDVGVLEFFQMAQKGFFPRFPREKYYSLCHVRDLVRGILTAAAAPVAVGQVYHIADPRARSMRALLNAIAGVLDKSPRWIPVPQALLRLVGPVADSLCRSFRIDSRPIADKVRELLPDYWVVDVSKAERELGFLTEVGLDEGLAETAEFYRSEGWVA